MPDDPKTADPQKARYIRGKDYRVVYTNSFRLRMAQGEVAVTFGYQTELANDTPVLTDEVEIVMTPMGVKFMSEALIEAVKELEKQFGALELPQELKDRLAEAAKPRDEAAKGT